jgi:acylphosphatase
MKPPVQVQLHAIVEGDVQGVGFRMFVQRKALDLNLTGWVRNRWNGEVEVLAEGSQEDLNQLLADLRIGPRSSFVVNVHIEWLPASGVYKYFQPRMTA